MKLILNALYKNIGNDTKVRFHIIGGEPTVNTSMINIIDEIFKSHINIEKVRIFTNGILLKNYINSLSNYDKSKLEINITYHAEQDKNNVFINILDEIKTSNLNFNVYILLNPSYKNAIDNLLSYLKKNENIHYVFTDMKNNKESVEMYKHYAYNTGRKVILTCNEDGKINQIYETDLQPGVFYGMKCMYVKKVFIIEPNGLITRACPFVNNIMDETYYAFFEKHIHNLLNSTAVNCVCNNKNMCDCDISFAYTKWKD